MCYKVRKNFELDLAEREQVDGRTEYHTVCDILIERGRPRVVRCGYGFGENGDRFACQVLSERGSSLIDVQRYMTDYDCTFEEAFRHFAEGEE